jgi:endonuclease YncB( thermonuclease family)
VRFYAADPAVWGVLRGRRVDTNRSGGAQLRLEGVDAPETHYAPRSEGARKRGGRVLHQPIAIARAASAALVSYVGFDHVERDEREAVRASSPAEVPGYVLTSSGDRYGRCISFAFAGAPAEPSGSEVVLDGERLVRSANHHMLATGLAYPSFYSSLAPRHRDLLAAAARRARSSRRGVWADDVTHVGFELTRSEDLENRAYVLPKLFRRLADYLAETDWQPSLSGFSAHLARRRDSVLVVGDDRHTTFDQLVHVRGNIVKLTRDCADLVFSES